MKKDEAITIAVILVLAGAILGLLALQVWAWWSQK